MTKTTTRVLSLTISAFAMGTIDDTALAQSAVRRPIISAAGTHGCPCPYDSVVGRDRVVYNCGRASSWSRSGGYEPTCYTSDYSRRIMVGGNITDWVDTLNYCYTDPINCRVR